MKVKDFIPQRLQLKKQPIPDLKALAVAKGRDIL